MFSREEERAGWSGWVGMCVCVGGVRGVCTEGIREGMKRRWRKVCRGGDGWGGGEETVGRG